MPDGTAADANVTRRTLLTTALAGAAVLVAPAAMANPSNRTAPGTGRFAGKVVLITGATSGIGEGTARAFAREGAKVFFNGRREKLGRKVEREIRAAGGNATYHQSDVRDEAQVKAFVAACVAAHSRIDIAFNNAGVARPEKARMHEMSETTYRDVMDTNVAGVFFGMKHEIMQMLAQGGGAIINTCSMGGFKAYPNISPYITSKHAVLGLTRAGAVEYAKDNIRITSIAPGLVDTPMLRELHKVGGAEGTYEASLTKTPMGRGETAEEMARVVMFLASDEASALHGSNVDVSAGFLD
ncbi:glucose 1-dehydrogenase [Spirosoma arcticum]